MAKGLAEMASETPAGVWLKASHALRGELGDDTYGSWLAPACLRTGPGGELCLVTPTGIARDWIRRYAWRRIGELWALFDPEGRPLTLKSRLEFETSGGDVPPVRNPSAPQAAPQPVTLEAVDPVSTDSPATAPLASARAGRGQFLQERFSFDSFVKGPSNEFALAVARRVASWADGHFNPVVFHGAYGFGKTHLLNAIAWEAMRTAPDKKVVYLTAERFLSSFVRSLMERKAADFKDELRSADLLLIDDVHFIGGKQSSEEELFHTLAALMEDGRRVVFSADRPPAALAEVDPRLRSHLSAGLVCGIDPADRSLRLDILQRKAASLCRQQGVSAQLRPDVLQFLADRFTDSVRELEGALNTLIVRAGSGVGGLTLDETRAFLGPTLHGGERRVTVDEIQKATADHFGLKQADLISERRTRVVARPRQAAMWLAKQLTTRSLPDIGRRFGGRDHTTVLHAVRRIEELRAGDPQLARDLETLVRKLRGA
jgi:chromosomal replication initiator protein